METVSAVRATVEHKRTIAEGGADHAVVVARAGVRAFVFLTFRQRRALGEMVAALMGGALAADELLARHTSKMRCLAPVLLQGDAVDAAQGCLRPDRAEAAWSRPGDCWLDVRVAEMFTVAYELWRDSAHGYRGLASLDGAVRVLADAAGIADPVYPMAQASLWESEAGS